MAKLPNVADHRQLQALGYPRREARRIAKKHNRTQARVATSQSKSAGVVQPLRRLAAGGEPALMLSRDTPPELRRLWEGQVARGERTLADAPAPASRRMAKKARRKLAAAGVDPDEARIMLAADADPEMQTMWLARMVTGRALATPQSSAPLGMDDDRLRLHEGAKELAAQKLARDPRLDPGEAYALSAIEIADKDSIWLS